MTRRRLGWLAALAGLVACSNLTATEEGVAVLVLFLPQVREVEVEQTIPLRAAALDSDGDTLAVPIYWRALDTTLVVDSVAGLLTGRTEGERGYVIARTGGLYSDSVQFSIVPRVDTLIQVAPMEDTVAIGEDSSEALTVRLEGGTPPVPIQGRRVIYQLIEPVFPSFEARTIDLTGDTLIRAELTSSTGEPFQPVRVRRRVGFTAPDSAVVEVTAYRPGGDPIPGSGQRFVVRFEHP